MEQAETLAEAIELLKEAAGGYDKFAAELGTSRQTVIRWVKHGVYPEDYIEQLRERGVPDRLLRRSTREELESRLRRVEAEMKELWRLL